MPGKVDWDDEKVTWDQPTPGEKKPIPAKTPSALGSAVGIATVAKLPEMAGKGLSAVGKLRAKAGPMAQQAAQFMTRTAAEETTKPLVEKYLAKTEKAEEVKGTRAERQTIKGSMQQRSGELGRQVKELDSKLRQEGNEKYAVVRQATANDPGVPATDLINAVEHAQNNILKGSTENIRQFREILQMRSEAETIGAGRAGAAGIDPNAPQFRNIVEYLEQQGISARPANIPFRDLQGYSSELGAKIAEGPKPGQGDVYQALKHVKNALDNAKRTIAERNGAGEALRDADSFWHQYLSAMYDKTSAISQVRKSVGVLDPEHYATPLVSGRAAGVGINKLKQLPTRHAQEANQIADLASGLRGSKAELEEIPKVKKPAEVEPVTAKAIEQSKVKALRSKALELGGARRYDLMVFLGGSGIGKLLYGNIGGALGGLTALAAEKAIAGSLNIPRIVQWITRPNMADLAAIEKLPEALKTQLRTDLLAVMKKQKEPIEVSPALTSSLGLTGTSAAQQQAIKSRKQAKDRLQSLQ